MIQDLDATLKLILERELPSPLNEQVAISFDTPDDQFPPTSVTPPAIDLFLYDVRENHEICAAMNGRLSAKVTAPAA